MTPLFGTPAADFDHPIEVLDGCHERIRRHCALIGKIAVHVAASGADAEARTSAASVVRFFDTAGADHHRDEEEDLFPAIKQFVPSRELNAIFALVAKLKADHRNLDSLWARMRERLTALIEGRDSGLTPERAQEFAATYERHIALEESQLLPIARRVLAPHVVAALGGSMARRRGVARPEA